MFLLLLLRNFLTSSSISLNFSSESFNILPLHSDPLHQELIKSNQQSHPYMPSSVVIILLLINYTLMHKRYDNSGIRLSYIL
jgi:hypothetical protein